MKTVSSTGWKTWILLTSLAATVAGWKTLSSGQPPVASVRASQAAAVPTRIRPARTGSGIDSRGPAPPRARTVPPQPRKPAFRAPVTRTRRS